MDRAWDWVVAVGVAAIMLITGLFTTGLELVGYPLLIVGGLALGERQRAPVVVLIVTGACAVGYQAAGYNAFAVAYLIAVYSAMRAGHRVATVVTSAVVLLSLPAAAMATGAQDLGEAFGRSRSVLELAWLIAAGAAGEALRQAEDRADEAVRTREAIARRRADEERLHIARELHDSLTHQISVIKVQSEAAVHVAERRGEPVPDALLAIRDAGRAASRDLRATLEALRDEAHAPPHGIDQIAELVRRAQGAGIATTLTIEGEPEEVPFAVDRTAYRIVQESLTNVARHASADSVVVHLGFRPGAVTIRVVDDGRATPETVSEPGIGLVGMRERVAALGGDLRAEPRTGGGFTVDAELPWDRTG
ncbi:sensor histidine kinase [Paractinoplanes brasiliensis]|uniref:histidine kinase n=1 Tax=Paractinoplanes brasiliensis TaxID=52695 RepID=A0A4R6JNR1_9ACTN|nr:sensor histidine kinase [Actinoplanes brasiliensis]TDO37402.1 signal transduction histidine kinase [Actinoplanes brasiliensis]GID29282.1 two-component sensor histidine kinase [Actinoplanes brasiliensis]